MVVMVRKVSGLDKDKRYAMKIMEKVKAVKSQKTIDNTRSERRVSLSSEEIFEIFDKLCF